PFRWTLLVPDDLDDPAAVALAVELEEQHPLPGAEAELAVAYRDRLAGRPEQHRHAVSMAVAEVHVLGADVLGAPVPVVVRVVALARDEALEQAREVLEEAALELVHADAARRVGRVDAGDAVGDAALAHGLADLLGDVADAQAARGSKLPLVLEDLHRTLTSSSRSPGPFWTIQPPSRNDYVRTMCASTSPRTRSRPRAPRSSPSCR